MTETRAADRCHKARRKVVSRRHWLSQEAYLKQGRITLSGDGEFKPISPIASASGLIELRIHLVGALPLFISRFRFIPRTDISYRLCSLSSCRLAVMRIGKTIVASPMMVTRRLFALTFFQETASSNEAPLRLPPSGRSSVI